MKTTIINETKVKVNETWEAFADGGAGIGSDGYDVAVYLSEGLSMWPCGKATDAEFGTLHCTCKTCNAVRRAIGGTARHERILK